MEIEYIARKCFTSGRTADEKTIKKTIDALLRRGFSYGEIRDALRRYEADLEDLELEETMTEELE